MKLFSLLVFYPHNDADTWRLNGFLGGIIHPSGPLYFYLAGLRGQRELVAFLNTPNCSVVPPASTMLL